MQMKHDVTIPDSKNTGIGLIYIIIGPCLVNVILYRDRNLLGNKGVWFCVFLHSACLPLTFAENPLHKTGLFSISFKNMVGVAQLAEHRVVAPVVEGSSPFTHPILPASRARSSAG